jgi:hypothetical protein
MTERATKDRRLGDEWADWDGSSTVDVDTRIEVFIWFTTLALVVVAGLFLFGLWLIEPRLELIDRHLGVVFDIAVYVTAVIGSLWLVIFAVGLVTERHIFLGILRATRVLDVLLPIIVSVASRMGYDRDRLSNAFIKANNILARPFVRVMQARDLLILLPRCLTRLVLDEIRALRERYGFEMEIVPGGEAARAAIIRCKPRAIIAVACERDLLSGIRDVGRKISVYGLPNHRPEGPCRNTTVDVAGVERMIQHVLRGAKSAV